MSSLRGLILGKGKKGSPLGRGGGGGGGGGGEGPRGGGGGGGGHLIDTAAQLFGLADDDSLLADVDDAARAIRAQMFVHALPRRADHCCQLLLGQPHVDGDPSRHLPSVVICQLEQLLGQATRYV